MPIKNGFCPFLGLPDDSATRLSYPSPWNYCHRARPVEGVKLEHQGACCLTDQYRTCPVFLRERPASLPLELRQRSAPAKPWKKGLWLLLGLLVLAGLFAGWQLSTGAIRVPPDLQLPLAWRQPSASPLPPSPLATQPAATTPAPSPSEAVTLTLEPPASPTDLPVCAYALDQQIELDGRILIAHRVLAGENMSFLASKYATTSDAIDAVNFFLPSPIWADLVIVIPVGTSQVGGLLSYQPVLVSENDISLDQLAQELSVAVLDLQTANGLDASCRSFSGWLLVPRTKLTP